MQLLLFYRLTSFANTTIFMVRWMVMFAPSLHTICAFFSRCCCCSHYIRKYRVHNTPAVPLFIELNDRLCYSDILMALQNGHLFQQRKLEFSFRWRKINPFFVRVCVCVIYFFAHTYMPFI